VTEALNPSNEFFGKKRLREATLAHAKESCIELHDAIQEVVKSFIDSAPQADDVTLVVLEYRPG
jgi:serine phosphatase RsbU (regulator of sigma subunit)